MCSPSCAKRPASWSSSSSRGVFCLHGQHATLRRRPRAALISSRLAALTSSRRPLFPSSYTDQPSRCPSPVVSMATGFGWRATTIFCYFRRLRFRAAASRDINVRYCLNSQPIAAMFVLHCATIYDDRNNPLSHCMLSQQITRTALFFLYFENSQLQSQIVITFPISKTYTSLTCHLKECSISKS